MTAMATPISSSKINTAERDELLKMIDEFTSTITSRNIIPSSELVNFALDLRLVLQNTN
jgi:hypothetical protein